MIIEETEEVGVRTRRQRKETGKNLSSGERLGSQLNELNKEAEQAFVASEMACGALVSDFQVNVIKTENVNIWGIRKRATMLEFFHLSLANFKLNHV